MLGFVVGVVCGVALAAVALLGALLFILVRRGPWTPPEPVVVAARAGERDGWERTADETTEWLNSLLLWTWNGVDKAALVEQVRWLPWHWASLPHRQRGRSAPRWLHSHCRPWWRLCRSCTRTWARARHA